MSNTIIGAPFETHSSMSSLLVDQTPGDEPADSVWISAVAKLTVLALKPVVLTLARLLAVTSSTS